MGDIYMTQAMGQKLVKLLITGMVCFLLLIAYVIWQSYAGRVDLVTSQRSACERSKKDRAVNAQGWRTAEKRSISQDQPAFGDFYASLASELEARSRIDCTLVFPNASLIP